MNGTVYYFSERSSMNNKFYCGIDVSKKKLDVVLLKEEKFHYKTFENSIEGVILLQEWLKNKLEQDAFVHFCIEATNVYHELAAFTLMENKNFKVSVVNPRRVKSYSKILVNTKTDKVDAKILALYCKQFNPNEFTPQSKERRELRDLSRLMDNLVELRIMQKVRLQTFKTEAAARVVIATIKSIDDSIAEIQQEINRYYEIYPELNGEKDLLVSIPSFGERVSNVLLTEIHKDKNGYYNSRRLTAFFGLDVREWQSGSSVLGKPRISKFGNPRVRNILYMSALVAIRHNEKMSEFYLKLVERGKPKKVALIAVARKLLVIACAILNSQQPYDKNHISYRKSNIAANTLNKELVKLA